MTKTHGDDLPAQMEVMRREAEERAQLVEAAEIDERELEQVSGGYTYGSRCSSTYDDTENCTWNDMCNRVIRYYKVRDNCKYTYDTTESCYVLEHAMGGR